MLGNISPEWSRLLIDLADFDDELEILGATKDLVGLLVELEELKADVVVRWQLQDGSEPGICSHLVLEHPNVRASASQLAWPNPALFSGSAKKSG